MLLARIRHEGPEQRSRSTGGALAVDLGLEVVHPILTGAARPGVLPDLGDHQWLPDRLGLHDVGGEAIPHVAGQRHAVSAVVVVLEHVDVG